MEDVRTLTFCQQMGFPLNHKKCSTFSRGAESNRDRLVLWRSSGVGRDSRGVVGRVLGAETRLLEPEKGPLNSWRVELVTSGCSLGSSPFQPHLGCFSCSWSPVASLLVSLVHHPGTPPGAPEPCPPKVAG